MRWNCVRCGEEYAAWKVIGLGMDAMSLICKGCADTPENRTFRAFRRLFDVPQSSTSSTIKEVKKNGN